MNFKAFVALLVRASVFTVGALAFTGISMGRAVPASLAVSLIGVSLITIALSIVYMRLTNKTQPRSLV